jgi:hypothetical protein
MKSWRFLLLFLGITVVLGLPAFALWPVCVPLAPEQTATFDPPITERTDTYLWGRVFQEESGRWYQCKTRVARALFF